MYNVESLRNGVLKAYENIKVFEQAIQKEKDTIKQYEMMADEIERKEKLNKVIDANNIRQ